MLAIPRRVEVGGIAALEVVVGDVDGVAPDALLAQNGTDDAILDELRFGAALLRGCGNAVLHEPCRHAETVLQRHLVDASMALDAHLEFARGGLDGGLDVEIDEGEGLAELGEDGSSLLTIG